MLTMGPLQSWTLMVLLLSAVVLGVMTLADFSRRFTDDTAAPVEADQVEEEA